MRREHNALENFKNLHQTRLQLAEAEAKRINEAAAQREDFRNNYHVIRDRKARLDAERSKLMEAARDDALATTIKAIYITALEAEALTDNGLFLAESMVDNWIKESGGASKILSKCGNNTYLLSRITQIVEEAAEEAVDEIEKDEEADEKAEEDDKKEDALDKAKEFIKDADKEEIKDFLNQVVDSVQDKSEDDGKEEAKAEEEDDAPKADNDDKADGIEKTSDTTEVDGDGKEESQPATTSDDEDVDVDAEMEIEDTPAEDDNTDSEEDSDSDKGEEEEAEEKDTEDDEEAASEEDSASNDDETPEEEVEPTDDDEDVDPDTEIEPADDDEKETDNGKVDTEGELEDLDDEEIDDELGDKIDDDGMDSDTTVDGDSENNGKVFDDLDKEEDVQKAIELIRSRVADAEETFIRNNAEDKKQINELLDRLSNNVKTVNDLEKKNPKKAEIAKEAAFENKRKINDVHDGRPITVFERMSRIFGSNIMKNEKVRDKYLTEDSQLDIDLVVESAKVMYGFLETLNTLQIEKVDEKYIAKTLNGMIE